MNKFDVAILGCGPGGLEAAKQLAQHGIKTAVIENGQWGGVCLNQGCIPTKMMLAASKAISNANNLKRQKELSGEITPIYGGIMGRMNRYVKVASNSVRETLQKLGVATFNGSAEFIDRKTISLSDQEIKIEAKIFIIATGSKPAQLPNIQTDHQLIFDSSDILALAEPPKSLLVIGAGAIGLEFGSFFNALGAKIFLVEAMDQLAPAEDADIAEALKNFLLKKDYEIHTGSKIKILQKENDHVRAMLENGTEIIAEKVLLAIGRVGNPPNNLQKAGFALNSKNFIEVNKYLQCGPESYAIGDSNGKVLLAHAAIHQGRHTAKNIYDYCSWPYNYTHAPSCIFGNIEIFRAGMTEKEARETLEDVQTTREELAANPVCQAMAAPYGFIKTIWSKEKLVGICGIGNSVTSLVGAAELLVTSDEPAEGLRDLMIAHPTLDESLGAAILKHPIYK